MLLTERRLGLITDGKIREIAGMMNDGDSSLIIDQEVIRASCSHNPRSGMSLCSPHVFTEGLEAWGFVTEIDRTERLKCIRLSLRCTCV